MKVRDPQTKRLKEAKAEAVMNDVTLNTMRELYYAERAINENTPIRMHIDLHEVPDGLTATQPIEEHKNR